MTTTTSLYSLDQESMGPDASEHIAKVSEESGRDSALEEGAEAGHRQRSVTS